MDQPNFTRRGIISGTAAGLTLPLIARAQPAVPPSAAPPPRNPTPDPAPMNIVLQVNGHNLALTLDPRTSLLDALRENAGLTGTKKGCDRGACGACTVHIDGRRVVSCLTLAARAQGHAITTIEGLANGDELHPMQAAFLHHDAYQCGYCTPGQIMSAVALITEGHTGSESEIREHMSGNICRCGAYNNIVDAIRDVAGRA
jgi:xanthine dehydrogenase YagT iron-sulfur-binding subunit